MNSFSFFSSFFKLPGVFEVLLSYMEDDSLIFLFLFFLLLHICGNVISEMDMK